MKQNQYSWGHHVQYSKEWKAARQRLRINRYEKVSPATPMLFDQAARYFLANEYAIREQVDRNKLTPFILPAQRKPAGVVIDNKFGLWLEKAKHDPYKVGFKPEKNYPRRRHESKTTLPNEHDTTDEA